MAGFHKPFGRLDAETVGNFPEVADPHPAMNQLAFVFGAGIVKHVRLNWMGS
jgi:hypothetical protein